MQTTVLCLLSLAALVAAAPPSAQITPGPFANKRDGTVGTITVVNSMSVALSTSVVSNAGNPTLVAGGESLTGTMAPGATATMVMPVGWSGNMALAMANSSALSGNNFPTLIEATLFEWDGVGIKHDVDISYVNGYTVSAICRCNTDRDLGNDNVLSGCTEDLWQSSSCGSDGEVLHADLGACQNPTNLADWSKNAATPFFAPCEGKAYTYPADNEANDGGSCTEYDITCCVGTEADGCEPASGSSSSSSSGGGGSSGASASGGAAPSATGGAR